MATAHGKLRCSFCGARARWLGFADETIRGNRYGIGVVVLCACRQDILRRVAHSLRLPGQYRPHMAKESARRRRKILSTVRTLDMVAVYTESRGPERTARSACWLSVIPVLVDLGVRTLRIERLDGVEPEDKASIAQALLKIDALGALEYGHESPRAEPLLWFADAITWASGARGSWASAISDIMIRRSAP